MSKVRFINGDLNLPDLGLSRVDRQEIIDNVSVVIHNAASVRFDMTLSEAIATNLIGTYAILEICKNIKHLESFCYVSTAYSQCAIDVTEERAYKGVIDPILAIRIAQHFDDDTMNVLLKKY